MGPTAPVAGPSCFVRRPRAARGKGVAATRTRVQRIALTLIILGLLVAAAGFYRGHRTASEGAGSPDLPHDASHLSLLVMGADARPGDPGRSDTMILVGVDLARGRVRMLSIPRDTWAEIPGHGWDKLNAAFAYGGVALARETVQRLTGVAVDHYVVVNMSGFKRIVDALGGVTVNVDENMNYDDPYDTPPLHIHLKKGVQHLDGTQALGFVRFRHDAQGDFGRMRRQQEFLRALARQALLPQNWVHLPELISALRDAVQTDLSASQALRLALLLHDKVSPGSVEGQTISDQNGGRDAWVDGIYYLVADPVKLRTMAYQTVFGTDPPADFLAQARSYAETYDASLAAALRRARPAPPTQAAGAPRAQPPASAAPRNDYSVVVVDASGRRLLPAYTPRLTSAGFRVVRVVPDAQPVPRTTVILYAELADARARLAALFPGAQFRQAPSQDVEAPILVFLGQDLAPPQAPDTGSRGTAGGAVAPGPAPAGAVRPGETQSGTPAGGGAPGPAQPSGESGGSSPAAPAGTESGAPGSPSANP
jgi:LCP family protein required for cell wall assembly